MTEIAAPLVLRRERLSEVSFSIRLGVVGCVAALLGLEAWAAATGYGLRVTSDTPSFLAIVRALARHPGHHVSPFLDDPRVASSHATPYMQLLALIWRIVGGDASAGANPFGLYLLLAVAGMVVTVILVHAVLVWARTEAGPQAAWLTIPVLLTLFGPAHVIWAGDLTFHGFLYAAYFPQNLALALLCYTLAALEIDDQERRFVLATLGVAGTFLVHPFTGTLLSVLIAVRGASLAFRRRRGWKVGSLALLVGFAVGELWPAYSLAHAFKEAGVGGPVFVFACAGLPLLARGLEQPCRAFAAGSRAEEWVRERTWIGRYVTTTLVIAGLAAVAALALWEVAILRGVGAGMLVRANRLGLYWVEDRWRWPLMFAAGLAGLVGIVRLAGRRRFVPAVWFVGCLLLGLVGAVGLHVPVWWRLLLFCQPPLALGTAVTLTRRGATRSILAATLLGAAAFKLVTLFALPGDTTYFGTPVQEVYSAFGGVLDRPGLVATDPFTAYFIPGATGHRVLTVTKAHVNSREELRASARGYELLHQYYMGPRWWAAARAMWRLGVRYIVVDKSTSLTPPTLVAFSTGPTPLIQNRAERRLLGVYFYRNNRIGTVVYDSDEYAVYALKRRKLWPA